MTKEYKPVTLEFAPGAFDDFEGTQEELDEFIQEITKAFEDGTLLDNSNVVDVDDLQDEDPELYAQIMGAMDDIDASNRKLN